MFEKPRLKAHLAARTSGPARVFLIAEDSYHLLRGTAAAAITPYLDGTHSLADIVAATSADVGYTDCVRMLATLMASGHLAGGEVTDRRVDAAWEARGLSRAEAERRFAGQTVTLVRVGEPPVDTVADALRACGFPVRVDDPLPDGGPVVVVTDEYLDLRLAELDAVFRAEGRPWLLAKPTGVEIWVGPYFRPGVTGCWHCLADRLDGNRPVGQHLRASTGDREPVRASVAASPASLGLWGYLVANVVIAALVDESPALEGALLSVRSTTLEAERHELIRRPQCPACGDPSLIPSAKVRLADGQVPVTFDGGRRVVPVDVTYQRLAKHVGRLLGAVSVLRRVDGTGGGVAYNYVAGHNFAVQPHSLDGLRRTLRGQSGGKGSSDAQARTGAVCEAIERYCGVWRDDRPTTTASLAQLGPEAAVAPGDLLLFSQRQYRDRLRWNASAAAGRLHTVPVPLDPDRPISWSSAWSLTEDRERLVPAGYAWFGHPDVRVHGYCVPDANGNAAGNTLEEAILQGFCELVERDGVALWWYNRVLRPGFDLDSLGDPYVGRLRELHAELGREVWVLDLTTDLGVPTFAAVSRRADHPVQDVLLGFGAHLDARIAVLRALSELNQFLPGVAERRTDGSTIYREDDQSVVDWWTTARVEREAWLRPSGQAPTSLATYPVLGGEDIAEDVRLCVGVAERAGLEMLVLDQSRPDIELAVAKVMVPGLRHFWRRLGPGRLYDVPVRLGWQDTTTTEDGCNPVSVFV